MYTNRSTPDAIESARSPRVASTLTDAPSPRGSEPSLTQLAEWTTPRMPERARRRSAGSRRSPMIHSIGGSPGRSIGGRRASPRTGWPATASPRATCPPTKPEAPVTRTGQSPASRSVGFTPVAPQAEENSIGTRSGDDPVSIAYVPPVGPRGEPLRVGHRNHPDGSRSIHEEGRGVSPGRLDTVPYHSIPGRPPSSPEHSRSRVESGLFDFNDILPVQTGPSLAVAGRGVRVVEGGDWPRLPTMIEARTIEGTHPAIRPA